MGHNICAKVKKKVKLENSQDVGVDYFGQSWFLSWKPHRRPNYLKHISTILHNSMYLENIPASTELLAFIFSYIVYISDIQKFI